MLDVLHVKRKTTVLMVASQQASKLNKKQLAWTSPWVKVNQILNKGPVSCCKPKPIVLMVALQQASKIQNIENS